EAHAVYAGGFLIFTMGRVNDAPLMAQAMDASDFRTTGDPFPIAESVDPSTGIWAQHQFSVSRDGVLAYASSGLSNGARLTLLDRSGKVLASLRAPVANILTPA